MFTYEERYVELGSLSYQGRKVISKHGTVWHVEEEKLHVPSLFNNAGYMLRSVDTGRVVWVRKTGDRAFKITHEYFETVEREEDISRSNHQGLAPQGWSAWLKERQEGVQS